ncbi:hypothetical protein BH10ACT1_BH10ACT1_31360 [soil metagenome]
MPGVTSATPKQDRPALSRERVVEAALVVIDERGIDGFTMRRLGAALGADPMSAYLHFANKAQLLDAVVEHQAARLRQLPDLDVTDVVEMIVEIGRFNRGILLEHPNLVPLLASRPLPQATASEDVVNGVDVLRAAGFADADIPMVFGALVTFTFGYVLHEAQREDRHRDLGETFARQQQALVDQMVALDRDTTVAQEVIARRLRPDHGEEGFICGLRAMLLGLRAGLGAAPSGSG